ncbi:MAG: hypothetical protein A2X36_07590 [Elusimicrobia bacterium GWA2_69_24]|nr:MAG: hypothetical protein A2X36_07590 [Elusimicrobia bacterium GWA2_69_24]HBL18023.1 hypothetical protein [Elusimicrobiota bacterium]
MNKKDGVFLGLLAAALAALLGPALFIPGRILGNFGDIYSYHYPLRHLVASFLQEGRLPFWNPYIFSGLPLFANPQAAVLYPGSALFYLLPIGAACDWHAALHLALAGLGMHLWARANRFEPAAASLLAAAFCLSPFLIYRIPQGIPTHLAALSYVPWCWLALQSGRRGFLAAVWALQFLSGHPQFSVINAGGMALCAGVSALRGRPDTLGVLLREGAAAAGLCLVQYFLAAEFLLESNRVGFPRGFAGAYSTPWSAWATLLWPGAWGDPLRESFRALPSEFFEEYALYLGAIPLALALASLAGKTQADRHPGLPPVWFGWLLAGLGVFLAAGDHNPVLRALADSGVGSMSRTPARYALWTLWGLLLAAAAGWASVRTQLKAPAWRAALLVLTLLDLGMWASRFVYAEDLAPYLQPRGNLVAELSGRPIRFLSDPELANPDKAMLYRMMDVNGYDAYFLARYGAYAARSERGPAADPSRTYLRRADTPEMRSLGVSRVLSSGDLPGSATPIAGNIRLFANPGALPLARVEEPGAAPAPAAAVMDGTDAWTLSGRVRSRASRLVLGVPYFPGWDAWVDGRRLAPELHDGLLQSVPLGGAAPGASFRARFLFRPTAWSLLCALTAAAWLAWLAGAPRNLFR